MGSKLVVLLAGLSLALAAPAGASQLIDRNATNVRLAVNASNKARLTYDADGRLKHVLAWGALNALPSTSGRPQVGFRLDYAGGWGAFRKDVWKTFRTSCGPYAGPPLSWLVTVCTARDGSLWAVQAFPQPLPDLGFTPWLPVQQATWLELSHWSGPLAKLEVWHDWVYDGRYQELFGRLIYDGRPVYGFGTTRDRAPTDGYGGLLYLDTFDSVYGSGWRRENSFVSHNPTGAFCYGFYPFDPMRGGYQHPPGYMGGLRGPGVGSQYRITAVGPGVTPDVTWHGPGFHGFKASDPSDRALERQLRSVRHQVIGPDKICRHGH